MSENLSQSLLPKGSKLSRAKPIDHHKDRIFTSFDQELSPLYSEGETIFSQLLSQKEAFGNRSIVNAMVVDVRGNDIIVDLFMKNYGKLSKNELIFGLDTIEILPGDRLDVLTQSLDAESRNEYVNVSWRSARKQLLWDEFKEAADKKTVVEGAIVREIRGGFIVNIKGASAFLPGSHVDFTPPDKEILDALKDTVQPFVILSMDTKTKNVVVSIREVRNQDRIRNKREAVKSVQVGDILDGVVKNIKDYGIFVSFTTSDNEQLDPEQQIWVDGLVHLHDLSHKRVRRPMDVPGIEVGAKVKVKVLKVDSADPKGPKISLGMKQLQSSPWLDLESTHFPGARFSGTVSNVADYGVFVSIPAKDESIDGLVHLSEISWSRGGNHRLEPGQKVDVVVISCDSEASRISLSIKRAQENPWKLFESKNNVGKIIKVEIKKTLDCGLFVDLTPFIESKERVAEIEGLIRPMNISWDSKDYRKLEEFKAGDMVEAKILHIDSEEGKVALGIKQVSHDPHEETLRKLNVGDVIKDAQIVGAWHEKLEVELPDCKTVIFISGEDLPQNLQTERIGRNLKGNKVNLKVVDVDPAKRFLKVKFTEEQVG